MTDVEERLLSAVSAGDEAAFRTLYRQHTPRLFAVLLRLLARRADAEDAAQEAWLRAVRGLSGFRRESSFASWLTGIGIRCALEILRKRPIESDAAMREAVATAGIELAVDLERAIAALPDGYRIVLLLHDVEGYTHEEIGRLLEVEPGTSKSQLFHARRALRLRLRPEREGARRRSAHRKDRRNPHCPSSRRSLASSSRRLRSSPVSWPSCERSRCFAPSVSRGGEIAAAVLLLGAGIAAGRFTAPSGLAPAPTQPRFLLLLSQAPTDSPGDGRVAEYRAWAIGLREAGRQISGERLAGEAVAVDQNSAPQAVNDDTQGYFIVSAASLDEAVALARSSPHVRAGGRVIVRPIASP